MPAKEEISDILENTKANEWLKKVFQQILSALTASVKPTQLVYKVKQGNAKYFTKILHIRPNLFYV